MFLVFWKVFIIVRVGGRVFFGLFGEGVFIVIIGVFFVFFLRFVLGFFWFERIFELVWVIEFEFSVFFKLENGIIFVVYFDEFVLLFFVLMILLVIEEVLLREFIFFFLLVSWLFLELLFLILFFLVLRLNSFGNVLEFFLLGIFFFLWLVFVLKLFLFVFFDLVFFVL